MSKNKITVTDRLDCFAEEFKELNLHAQTIKHSEFEDCTFVSCDFSETLFHSCRLIDCRFENCNLAVMKLTDTIVSGTEFMSCKMIGIDWSMCDWNSLLNGNPIRYKNSILNDSNFYGLTLEGVEIVESQAKDVDFSSGTFIRANFKSSDFKGALFDDTNLEYANFTNSVNTNINLRKNRLKGAIFNRYEATFLLENIGIVLVD